MPPIAMPLHLPSAAELEAAHEIFEAREPKAHVWNDARAILADGADSTSAQVEAIHLLLRRWNPLPPQTHRLADDSTAALLESTAAARAAFEDRAIESLGDEDHAGIVAVYRLFQEEMAYVGAAKALALLNPRFFPLWDNPIAKAHLGSTCLQPDRAAGSYLTFMGLCAQQCSAQVTEAEFGGTLLKTLDEWKFCIWTKKWISPPGSA